jgi:hypothetical protein
MYMKKAMDLSTLFGWTCLIVSYMILLSLKLLEGVADLHGPINRIIPSGVCWTEYLSPKSGSKNIQKSN